jgi:hypothetical protein
MRNIEKIDLSVGNLEYDEGTIVGKTNLKVFIIDYYKKKLGHRS